MTVTRTTILQELRHNIAQCARLLQQQQELLKWMETTLENDVESEVQAQLTDLRTRIEKETINDTRPNEHNDPA